jgi:thermostable 8-oxoguanine DNA glycosylase
MDINWKIECEDIQKVKALVSQFHDHPLLRKRREENLSPDKQPADRAEVWWAMVSCLVTTQQRSGPHSRASRFINQEPFQLDFDRCKQEADLDLFAESVLQKAGLRRYNVVAGEIARNWSYFAEQWQAVQCKLEQLANDQTVHGEREAAKFLARELHGVGPKQSRNLLQALGLTRYEIPLDSRIIKWLNGLGFPVHLSSQALTDINYYLFVEDGIHALCKASDVVPCILDAAIFVSYDGEGWNDNNVF